MEQVNTNKIKKKNGTQVSKNKVLKMEYRGSVWIIESPVMVDTFVTLINKFMKQRHPAVYLKNWTRIVHQEANSYYDTGPSTVFSFELFEI